MNAREIIRAALTFHLNRLSPGESEDADTFGTALTALNFIVDAENGRKAFLYKVNRTAGTVSGASGTLGTTWAAVSPGDLILGAFYNNGSVDVTLGELTPEQYDAIPSKSMTGDPLYWSHDGLSTVYFYPVPSSRSVTLRTRGPLSDFADLSTEYTAPDGYKSWLAAELAFALAPTMAPTLLQTAAVVAGAARARVHAQAYRPAIVDSDECATDAYDVQRGF